MRIKIPISYQLGNALHGQGKILEAIEQYHHALRIKPNNAMAHNNLGNALRGQGKIAEAIEHFHYALRIKPDYAEAHNNLGIVLQGQGKVAEAIEQYRQALQIKPDFAMAYFNLGLALQGQGKIAEAVEHYHQALQIKPGHAMAYNNLAWIRATHRDAALRDGTQAVELAERCCELTGHRAAGYLDTLAAAYAEAGRFGEAIKTAVKAIEVATAAGDEKLAREIRGRMELFRQGVPYRESSQ